MNNINEDTNNCPTCGGMNRQTTDMVCQTCGRDFMDRTPLQWHKIARANSHEVEVKTELYEAALSNYNGLLLENADLREAIHKYEVRTEMRNRVNQQNDDLINRLRDIVQDQAEKLTARQAEVDRLNGIILEQGGGGYMPTETDELKVPFDSDEYYKRVRSVECRKCNAQAGEDCFTSSGQRTTTFHVVRKQDAADRAKEIDDWQMKRNVKPGGQMSIEIISDNANSPDRQPTTWKLTCSEHSDWETSGNWTECMDAEEQHWEQEHSGERPPRNIVREKP